MAKKYIVPHILILETEYEDISILPDSQVSTRDGIRSYGITGGGYANTGQDTESKKRNTLFDLDNGADW